MKRNVIPIEASKKNIDIVVLHPANKVSEYQRKQMTTVIQDNVLNIAVEGSYDDCQRIVKNLLSERHSFITGHSAQINFAALTFFIAFMDDPTGKNMSESVFAHSPSNIQSSCSKSKFNICTFLNTL